MQVGHKADFSLTSAVISSQIITAKYWGGSFISTTHNITEGPLWKRLRSLEYQNCGLVSKSEASRAGLSAERSAWEEPRLPNTRGKGREGMYRQLMLLVRQTCQALPERWSQATSSDKASGCYQNFLSGLVFPGPFRQEKVVFQSVSVRINFHT